MFLIIGVIVTILIMIVGRFYFSVYASEYVCKDIDGVDSAVAIENNSNTLRVGTYNIKSLNYSKSKESLGRFVEDVKELDLDIIALQEVDQKSIRSNNMAMTKELAVASGYPYYHFFSTMWILDGYYGIAILSKYPIMEVTSNLLPNSLLKEPRILTESKIRIGKEIISIFNTHITYENDEYRKSQINYIQQKLLHKEKSILLGDFNNWNINPVLQIDTMNRINGTGEYITFKNFGTPDDIYHSLDLSLVNATVKASSFSDHNILYAEFIIGN